MNKDWIKWEWTAEKPYPETLETMVRVRYKNGTADVEMLPLWSVKDHQGVINGGSGWRPVGLSSRIITHYRLA